MSLNRADQHDEDKLKRWLSALLKESSNDFPLYALFLVSENDKYAHDIFRRFRSQFEQSGAGFQHLIILGQHGISKSELGLLSSLELLPESVPCLLVFVAGDPTLFRNIKLKAKNIYIETTGDGSDGSFLVKANDHISLTAGEQMNITGSKICMVSADSITLNAKGNLNLLVSDVIKRGPLSGVISILQGDLLAFIEEVRQTCK